MKTIVALALAFLLGTFGFLIIHNVAHHEDEPELVLPGPPAPSAPSSSPAPSSSTSAVPTSLTPRPPKPSDPGPTPTHRNVTLVRTIGTTERTTLAGGRSETRELANTLGRGNGRVSRSARAMGVRSSSQGTTGESSWFAALGSDFVIDPGDGSGRSATISIEGLKWYGTLTSDGGTASIVIRLEARDSSGALIGSTQLLDATRSTPGISDLNSGKPRVASLTIPLSPDPAGLIVQFYLYAEARAQGGSGKTLVDFFDDAAGGPQTNGLRFTAITATVGGPIAVTSTTAPPVLAGVGITAAQLAQHATEQSCWLLINGRVYDMTRYLKRHPGSQLPVLKVCGKEATEAFLSQGGRGSRHSYEAIDKLAALYLGDFVG